MLKFKCFEGVGSAELEDKVNSYLKDHPEMVVLNMQMCDMSCGPVYVGIMFRELTAPADLFSTFIPKDREVVVSEDPWQGEFIPVGDPPRQEPRYNNAPPCPSGKNFRQYDRPYVDRMP